MEIEFELPAFQHKVSGYATIRQGEPLTVTLESDILLPDPAASSWFVVQKEPLPAHFVRIAPATYAFSGQISAAELEKKRAKNGQRCWSNVARFPCASPVPPTKVADCLLVLGRRAF